MTQDTPLCRSCLSSHSLVEMRQTKVNPTCNQSLLELFQICTGLKIDDEDKNCNLCQKCYGLLLLIADFRSQAVKNQCFFIIKKEEEKEEESEVKYEADEYIDYEVLSEVELPVAPSPKRVDYQRCHFCFENFKLSKERKAHEEIHIKENGGMECDFCGKRFHQRIAIATHIKAVHLKDKSIRYECDKCHKLFTQKVTLNTHKKVQHGAERPKYLCAQCPKYYATKSKLNNHIRIKHENKLSLPCEECGKCFITNSYLKQHMKAVHLRLRDFQCTICGKSFGSHASKINHEKLHAIESIYQCDECQLSFKVKAALKRHKHVRHTSIFSYCCDVCGAKFRESTGLRIHSFSHQAPGFQCVQCSKLFTRKMTLKHHIKSVHEGEKISCDVCKMSFASKSTMMNHRQVVHQGLRYRCSCGKEYRKKISWNEHILVCNEARPEGEPRVVTIISKPETFADYKET